MASTYAGRLKKGVHYGTCGLPELFDSAREMHSKATALAQLLRNSRHVVVFTGAGASTSAGIPDFRGPNGVWTQEQKREKAETANAKRPATWVEPLPSPAREVSFEEARPTFTHMAIVTLIKAGIVKFLVSQNVDGLHIRSGVPVDSIAELHGNVFKEKCDNCGAANFLCEEIQSISFQPTGRTCACGGVMRDTLLDWDDPLPEDAYDLAQANCEKADLVLCLGTSLRVAPANTLPVAAVRKNRAKLVIVNLQRTPKDQYAHINIRSRCDEVMECVLQQLSLAPLPSRLADSVSLQVQPTADGALRVQVAPPVGSRLPFVESVGIGVPHGDDAQDVTEMKTHHQPFTLTLPAAPLAKTTLNVMLYLQKWCTRPTWPLTVEVATHERSEHTSEVEFHHQPFAVSSSNRARSRDVLVEAHDDPDKLFKKKRKPSD